MKIVHVIESTATGTLSICSLMANLQAKDGHEVIVFFSRREDTPSNIETYFSKNIQVKEVNLSVSNFPKSVFKLRRLLKSLDPDIAHSHSSISGFVTRLSSINLNIKVFYSPHCISFMRKDIGFVKNNLFKLFEFVACAKSSIYLACSHSELVSIKKTLPFVNLKLLENAVELSDFYWRLPIESDSDKIKIVTVGGIRPQKGPCEFTAIAHAFNDKNVDFIWVGDGDNDTKQQLIDAGVTVTGWKPRDEVIQELYSADLYLSTALWEGMPVSLIEACAANIPIIARSCAGNVDVVEHKKTGHLFDSTTEATELIEHFLKDPTPYKLYADNAYNSVFERFSEERFSKELTEIYNS